MHNTLVCPSFCSPSLAAKCASIWHHVQGAFESATVERCIMVGRSRYRGLCDRSNTVGTMCLWMAESAPRPAGMPVNVRERAVVASALRLHDANKAYLSMYHGPPRRLQKGLCQKARRTGCSPTQFTRCLACRFCAPRIFVKGTCNFRLRVACMEFRFRRLAWAQIVARRRKRGGDSAPDQVLTAMFV